MEFNEFMQSVIVLVILLLAGFFVFNAGKWNAQAEIIEIRCPGVLVK